MVLQSSRPTIKGDFFKNLTQTSSIRAVLIPRVTAVYPLHLQVATIFMAEPIKTRTT